MRVYVDHTQCPEWAPASERCLGCFLLDPERTRDRACFLARQEDGHRELTLVIYERGGPRVLVVDEDNRRDLFGHYLAAPDMRREAIRRGLIREEEISGRAA